MPKVSFLIGDPICYWSKKHPGVLKDFSKILVGRDRMGDRISSRGNGTGKESTAAEELGQALRISRNLRVQEKNVASRRGTADCSRLAFIPSTLGRH